MFNYETNISGMCDNCLRTELGELHSPRYLIRLIELLGIVLTDEINGVLPAERPLGRRECSLISFLCFFTWREMKSGREDDCFCPVHDGFVKPASEHY